MKKFQPLRYIRRFIAWMLIYIIVGSIGCYCVLQKAQAYTAQTTLTFNDSAMENNGLNPDGTAFDMLEVKSAEVVEAALKKLDTDYTMEEIRGAITVEEVIPEDIAAIRAGAWEDGLEYIYYPTSYTVSCTLKSKDVSVILNAVIDSYLSYYEDTHMGFMRIPERIESVSDADYDYIEYAEALDTYFDNNLEFLGKATTYWSDYRCNSTGYSFAALEKEYQYEADQSLAKLYSQIIDGKVTKDASSLIDRYTNRKVDNALSIEAYERSIDNYQTLIATYTEKRMDSYEYWQNSNTTSADEMLDDVYTVDGSSDAYRTVYDDWLESCANLHQSISALEADTLYCDYVLNAFEGARNATADSAAQVQTLIETIYAKMFSLDAVLMETYAAYCDYAVAQSVSVDETPYASAKYSIKLYTAIAVLLLIVSAAVLAIVVGRLMDFSAYLGLTDSTEEATTPVKVPEKTFEAASSKAPAPAESWDALLGDYATKKLPIPCALLAFETEVNREGEFERILSGAIGERGKIARTENGRFFCFLENGSSELAEEISDEVAKEAMDKAISYRSAFSVNSWLHPVDITELETETENKLMLESVEVL